MNVPMKPCDWKCNECDSRCEDDTSIFNLEKSVDKEEEV